MPDDVVSIMLAGDVMTGRGVDQILPHPGDPRLWEGYVHDARDYVELAEARNGAIPQPVGFEWPWGVVLEVLAETEPDLWLMNLETSVTTSSHVARGKAVNYRMHPDNVGCLTAARVDVCSLANNHILDFGESGLVETLDRLEQAGLATVGAGRDLAEARRPLRVPLGPGRGGIVVVGCGHRSSGVPRSWAATSDRPGVNLLPDLSPDAADALLTDIDRVRQDGDVVVVSVHWGGNWGYEVSDAERDFAHRLVDGGVDVVHGHSSHHPRSVETYRDRLVLYGCGDLLDDYEGIGGNEEYRPDLRLLYRVSVQAGTGRLVRLDAVPLQAHRMRLRHASVQDARWLADRLAMWDVIRPHAESLTSPNAEDRPASSRATGTRNGEQDT